MSALAVFCRTNHPAGYGGFPDVPSGAPKSMQEWYRRSSQGRDEMRSGAHGYVTLLVECKNADEVAAVETRLRDWFEWDTRGDLWYSGTFDLVAVIEPYSPVRFHIKNNYRALAAPSWTSYGDNRACAVLSANDVLPARVEGDTSPSDESEKTK